jgi:hypothetical protein
MKSRFGGAVITAALVTSFFASEPAAGQDRRGGPPSPQDRAEMERRVQEGIEQLVRQTLGLDEEGARRFGQMFTGFQRERQALVRREADLMRKHGLVPPPPDRNQGGSNSPGGRGGSGGSGGSTSPGGRGSSGGIPGDRAGPPSITSVLRQVPALPDDRATEVLREMRAIQQAEFDLYVREQEQLKTVLTTGQLVRYYVMLDRVNEYLRRGGPGGFGRGGPTPPGGNPQPSGQRVPAQTPRTQPATPPPVP